MHCFMFSLLCASTTKCAQHLCITIMASHLISEQACIFVGLIECHPQVSQPQILPVLYPQMRCYLWRYQRKCASDITLKIR